MCVRILCVCVCVGVCVGGVASNTCFVVALRSQQTTLCSLSTSQGGVGRCCGAGGALKRTRWARLTILLILSLSLCLSLLHSGSAVHSFISKALQSPGYGLSWNWNWSWCWRWIRNCSCDAPQCHRPSRACAW